MTWGWIVAALAIGAALAAAAAVESRTALKADEIKDEPCKDARTVGKIAKGDKVEILARQSGWLQVKAGGKQGWVRMLSVRRGQAGQTDAAKELGGVAGLATGRAGTGEVVSSTGVRGLSEEELKGARFSRACWASSGTISRLRTLPAWEASKAAM